MQPAMQPRIISGTGYTKPALVMRPSEVSSVSAAPVTIVPTTAPVFRAIVPSFPTVGSGVAHAAMCGATTYASSATAQTSRNPRFSTAAMPVATAPKVVPMPAIGALAPSNPTVAPRVAHMPVCGATTYMSPAAAQPTTIPTLSAAAMPATTIRAVPAHVIQGPTTVSRSMNGSSALVSSGPIGYYSSAPNTIPRFQPSYEQGVMGGLGLAQEEHLNNVANIFGTAFSSKAGAAGLMDGVPMSDPYSGGLAFFIIDPQVDFHEGGNLAVPGASEDSRKIANLIRENSDKIERIVVSLDTHHALHIHHQYFWKGKDGQNPAPFTPITKDDILNGTWAPRQPEMTDWALEYVEKLNSGGKFTMSIWPDHCLFGTKGHCVHPPLMEAFNEWAVRKMRAINWYFKGQNNRAEMYSALKAEVEVPDDQTTSMDHDLIRTLAKHEKVVCCGEAMSHCVNFSTRDLLSGWDKRRAGDIILLEDCTSAVDGFEEDAKKFVADMRKSGVTVCNASEFSKQTANVVTIGATMNGVRPVRRKRLCRQSTGFASKAGAAGQMDGHPLIDTYSGGLALFIIDPQVDFHEGGSLAVPGATEDSRRIAALIRQFKNEIERIVVTVDTHHKMHMHHADFWTNREGGKPDPLTILTPEDISSGKWMARQEELRDWSLEYAKKLHGGPLPFIIWPDHCLLGSEGHCIHPPLMEALNEWAIARTRSLNFYFKGQNNRAEMYSALKSEVPVPDDPSTDLDLDLVAELAKHDKVLCCGEAKSHCVNFSVRHLVEAWPKNRVSDVVLLNDCCSAVPGFEEVANTFVADMREAGVTVVNSDSFSN